MTKVNDIIKELNDCVNELDEIIENARSTENTSGLDSFENFEVKAKNIMSVDAEDEYHAVRLSQGMYTLKEKFFDVIVDKGVWGVRYCPLCRYHDRHIADTGTCEECVLRPGSIACHPTYKDFAESFTREKFDELKAAIDALPSEPPEDKMWSPYVYVKLKARVAQLEEENRGLRKKLSRVQDAIDDCREQYFLKKAREET